MKKFTQVIVVNHNPQVSSDLVKGVLDSGLTGDVKVVMNGGHALMHIDHLHLSGRVNEGQILVLLNLETPMVSGFEFLNEYKASRNLKKENICIAVIDNGLSPDHKARVEKLGIATYISIRNCKEDVKRIANPSGTSGQSTVMAA